MKPSPDRSGIITMTTDFGHRDWYVAAMRGVILSIHSNAILTDITHEVPPCNILAGAIVLDQAIRTFPVGTVHLAVVDPGVGSTRKAVVAASDGHYFVGPDNGLFSMVFRRAEQVALFELSPPESPISPTFHGRDLFAPAAARLSLGTPIESLGTRLKTYEPLDVQIGGSQHGSIIYIDHYGNAITNLTVPDDEIRYQLIVDLPTGPNVFDLRKYYREVPNGTPLSLVGSSGLVEVAINEGNAAKSLQISEGISVYLRPESEFKQSPQKPQKP